MMSRNNENDNMKEYGSKDRYDQNDEKTTIIILCNDECSLKIYVADLTKLNIG